MMAAAREWLTALTALTLLLSVAQLLTPQGTLREIVSFIGGLLLLLVLLQPLTDVELTDLTAELSACQTELEQRQDELERQQTEALTTRIEAETEAYIWDKAREMGLTLTVQVTAQPNHDGVPVPVRAVLNGQRSEALAAWLETELGLPAEGQVWNEEN